MKQSIYKCDTVRMYCPELRLSVSTSGGQFLLVIGVFKSSSLEGSPSADRNLVTDYTWCQQIKAILVFLISSAHEIAASKVILYLVTYCVREALQVAFKLQSAELVF